MSSLVNVDGLLVEWGEQFFQPSAFWGPRHRAPAGARGASTRPPVPAPNARRGGSLDARSVRARLGALVGKSPQVMVKVYGGGRGMKAVRAHLRYIARAGREGEVPIEDQDGFRTTGVEALRALAEDWQQGEVHIEETSTRREALNIVLSMPAGTDPLAVQKAARDFAASEFVHHKYALALHTLDTPHYAEDRHDPPSPHPHVHLVVQSAGFHGERLNPRKADLHRWREVFAQALRDHGVDAVATSRAHRLHRSRGERSAVRQMRDRKKEFTQRPRTQALPERVEKARATERIILGRYAAVAEILAESESPTDRLLGAALADRFGLDRPTPTPHHPREAAAEDGAARVHPERALPIRRRGSVDRER